MMTDGRLVGASWQFFLLGYGGLAVRFLVIGNGGLFMRWYASPTLGWAIFALATIAIDMFMEREVRQIMIRALHFTPLYH